MVHNRANVVAKFEVVEKMIRRQRTDEQSYHTRRGPDVLDEFVLHVVSSVRWNTRVCVYSFCDYIIDICREACSVCREINRLSSLRSSLR